ncbi:MAG: LapA family protein [Gammaproteobacteria bacterium]|nr:LapA family protein [Gammaproteobacteria bacterium]
MIRFLVLLLLIPIIVFIAAFTYRNAGLVSVDLFTLDYKVPLAALLLIALLVGMILGYLVNIFVLIKQKNRIRQLKKQREALTSLSDVFKADK